jgi:transposase
MKKRIAKYGEKVKAVSVYLTQYQLIPFNRTKELFKDILNISISQDSLVTFNDTCHDRLETIEKNFKEAIASEKGVVHFDEIVAYVDNKRKWLHVSTERKQGENILDCGKSIFTSNPIDPTLT